MNRSPHAVTSWLTKVSAAARRLSRVWGWCALPLAAMVATGCVSKAKARAQTQAAFAAGQQQAMAAMRLQSAQSLSVRVEGPVANPVIPWTPELTLVKALIAAQYQGASDPKEIIYIRNGVGTRLQTESLFNGHDIPLEAGDIIKLQGPAN